MIQEVITYLGQIIRSSPALFQGIMRVRTHFFVIAMREEISRSAKCDEEEAIEQLMAVRSCEIEFAIILYMFALSFVAEPV